jgi:hypothetical protein
MGDRVTCPVHSWSGETDTGLHPAPGGDGSLACSADMLGLWSYSSRWPVKVSSS